MTYANFNKKLLKKVGARRAPTLHSASDGQTYRPTTLTGFL